MHKKKLLLITSDRTGFGHKSVSTAISEYLLSNYDNIEILPINGFLLAGNLGKATENSYLPIVRYAKPLWKIYYTFGSKYSWLLNMYISFTIRKGFLKHLKEFKPDLIVSVHPGFVGSVLDILQKSNMSIPFIVVISDLFEISNLWIDKRSTYTACPNLHIKNILLDKGISEDSILLSGFPLRNQFKERLLQHNQVIDNKNLEKPYLTFKKDASLKFLFFCNTESPMKVKKIIKLLCDNYNCHITVITGNNKGLKYILEKTLSDKYISHLALHGYVEDMVSHMLQCDILITKGGPNIIMEAINSSTPLILIGSVPGQEEGNNEFVEKNRLGIVCTKNKELIPKINTLLSNNGKLLNEIKENTLKFCDLDSIERICKLIVSSM